MLHPCCNFSSTAGLGGGGGRDAACILRGRVNARDLRLFPREDRLCQGRKATCRTRESHMHFGSPPKCTWLRFLLAANARVCCSVEARRGCGRPDKAPLPPPPPSPPCILAERLNARGLRLPSLGSDEGSGKALCIFSGCLNARALPIIFQAVLPLSPGPLECSSCQDMSLAISPRFKAIPLRVGVAGIGHILQALRMYVGVCFTGGAWGRGRGMPHAFCEAAQMHGIASLSKRG